MTYSEIRDFIAMLHLLYQDKIITKEEFRNMLKNLTPYKDIFKKKVSK